MNDAISKGNGQATSRRSFLGAAVGAAAFSVVPRYVLGGPGEKPPSERLNIAGVGLHYVGARNLGKLESENIVALCDVDTRWTDKAAEKWPKARKWKDYRRMLEEQKDIEGVIVATPDHWHAIITSMAMKLGKHVYTQKPLTQNVWEARQLQKIARETGVVTQMGHQGHSGNGTRRVVEWIRAGTIGTVREVHCWSPKPAGSWEQGSVKTPEAPVPAALDWDMWVGPAEMRPYSPVYHPFTWRGFWDFGGGALGDMGCHIMNAAWWALDLAAPTAVEACSTKVYEETACDASVVHYEFPARGKRPALDLYWYDGGLKPPRPIVMERDRKLRNSGTLFVGEDGCLSCGTYGTDPMLIPASRMENFDSPPETIPRVNYGKGDIEWQHEHNWAHAAKEGTKAVSDFEYACPLAEAVQLGNVAVRTRRRIEWDAENLRVTNVPEANKLVHPEYRGEWSL